MKSSQALAQSVFANLIVMKRTSALASVVSSEGVPVFAAAGQSAMKLEQSMVQLGEVEGRSTEVDVWLHGEKRVAVECKWCESDVGHCSRPRLAPIEAHYCNGSYTRQLGRESLCSLSEIGIRYWDYIPQLLRWNSGVELSPCPLHSTYQIVRNVLAARVDEQGNVIDGLAVLLVDERNPAFQTGGAGRIAFDQVKSALHQPETLQLCSWQAVLVALRGHADLVGLTAQIAEKYGF